MADISVVIVAKNEADRISQTIQSAQQVTSEVLVVDTGSTDDTIEVSKSNGAKTISLPWQGYGATKNAAVTHATHDWILSLDADEVLSEELIKNITALTLDEKHTYAFNRLVRFQDQWIKTCGWHPDWIPRLYHRSRARWNLSSVHEKLIFDNSLIKINGPLEHYSYRSVEHFKEKIDAYAKLTAQGWIDTGDQPPLLKRLFGKQWKFVKSYYLQQGYKDGNLGKLISSVMADGVAKKIYYYDQLSSNK